MNKWDAGAGLGVLLMSWGLGQWSWGLAALFLGSVVTLLCLVVALKRHSAVRQRGRRASQ